MSSAKLSLFPQYRPPATVILSHNLDCAAGTLVPDFDIKVLAFQDVVPRNILIYIFEGSVPWCTA